MSPPKSFGFVVGGCWYRMQCRDRVAASISHLAYLAGIARAPYLGLSVMHTSNLFTGRLEWLRARIADPEIRWAIAVDSDTSFNARHVMESFADVADPSVAIGIAPVRVGGTESICNINLLTTDERLGTKTGRMATQQGGEIRIIADELAAVLTGNREIASGGFGLAFFHLEWFRNHWQSPYPEVANSRDFGGEDIEFCRAVRRRRGKIVALSIETEHHEFKP